MFAQRKFFPISANDPLFGFSLGGDAAFDWEDLANNSAQALLNMCRKNDLQIDPPYLKRTMILQLREFMESRGKRATLQLAPSREHVANLRIDYLSTSTKSQKRQAYTPSRSSTSSVTSEEYSSTTSSVPLNQPYLEEDRLKEKANLVDTVRLAFKAPTKFMNEILSISPEKQRNVFRYLFAALHIILFVSYLTSNNFKLQKPPRTLNYP